MLCPTPTVSPERQAQLVELDELRHRLGLQVGEAGLWLGTLRRLVQATSIESSTSIEGFHVPTEEAVALVSGDESPTPDDQNQLAVACYARAMEHVGVMAADPGFRWYDRVILDLQFDACEFQRDKSPGRWRSDPIRVASGDGRTLYQAPDAEDVPARMAEVVDWLENGDLDAHAVVRAAMAHLHVVSIHPFGDGNGRISRITQSLVLAREGLLSPEFASIEEYLGQHAPDYYRVLQQVQGGSYQPERDATPWITFCLEAHLAQARHRLAQIDQAAKRWSYLEHLAQERGWPDRLVIALEQALISGTNRTRYSTEADISPASATNDLRRLLDAGLITQHGRGRNTRYVASDQLRDRIARPHDNVTTF
ncbi:MAG: Fic family protein [Gaiellaceae bacterium]